LKVGGQCIGRWGVNTVKTVKLKKWEVQTPPPSFYCGPALLVYNIRERERAISDINNEGLTPNNRFNEATVYLKHLEL